MKKEMVAIQELQELHIVEGDKTELAILELV